MPLFRPKEIIPRFDSFDIKKYANMGFNAILIDIDNTIAVPDTELIASNEANEFINDLKQNGFKVILMSNNTYRRVKPYAQSANADFNCWSFKPFPFSYIYVLKKYNLDRKKVISFGDQLITDCLGANIVGIYPVYVKQLMRKDKRLTRINRFLERFIFKYLLHEKM